MKVSDIRHSITLELLAGARQEVGMTAVSHTGVGRMQACVVAEGLPCIVALQTAPAVGSG
jgi:hypothetical protein